MLPSARCISHCRYASSNSSVARSFCSRNVSVGIELDRLGVGCRSPAGGDQVDDAGRATGRHCARPRCAAPGRCPASRTRPAGPSPPGPAARHIPGGRRREKYSMSSGMSSRRSRSGGIWWRRPRRAGSTDPRGTPPARPGRLEIPVGGGDDPDVDLELLGAAHPAQPAGLEHAQQLGLQVLGQLADLVEEHRAPVGQLERPLAPLMGPGERALLVAEQLALDQVGRHRPAVDHHERALVARRCWCTARAMRSLPVPVSPSRSTVTSVGATRSSTPKILRIARLRPMTSPKRSCSLGKQLRAGVPGQEPHLDLADAHHVAGLEEGVADPGAAR